MFLFSLVTGASTTSVRSSSTPLYLCILDEFSCSLKRTDFYHTLPVGSLSSTFQLDCRLEVRGV